MGAAVSRWACQTQTPPLAGMNDSGRGGLRWGHPAGQFKAHSTSKYPSDLEGVSSFLHCTPSPICLRLPTWKAGSISQETDTEPSFDIMGLGQVINSSSALGKTACVAS